MYGSALRQPAKDSRVAPNQKSGKQLPPLGLKGQRGLAVIRPLRR